MRALLRFVLTALTLALLAGAISCGSARDASAVTAAPVPAGIEPELWRELTRELERQLNGGTGARAGVADRITGEGAGATRSASALTQPAQLEYDQGSATLSWYVVHPGDYNLDGLVTVADLTPLGAHFGEVASAIFGTPLFPHSSIHSAVDGDNNGEINIADVTPIAVNFGGRLEGYRIYRSADPLDNPADPQQPNGPGSQLVATLGLAAATQAFEERKRLSAQIVPTSITQHYWVRPFVGLSDGAASASVEVKAVSNFPPIARLTAPTEGSTPAKITYDASASSDPDGSIVKYEWDFDGDGEFEYDSGADGVVDYYYYAPGEFVTTVRVTDDLGGTSDTSVAVAIEERAIWHETLLDDILPGDGEDFPHQSLIDHDGKPVLALNGSSESRILRSNDLGDSWQTMKQFAEPVGEILWLGRWKALPAAVVKEHLPPTHLRLYEPTSSTLSEWTYKEVAAPLEAQYASMSQVAFFGEGAVPLMMWEKSFGMVRVQAADQDGSSWGLFETFSTPLFVEERSAPINGYPAFVEHRAGRDLLYWEAADQLATSWNAPTQINSQSVAGENCRLIEVAGRPAVVYFDTARGVLIYARAEDEHGSSWAEGVELTDRSRSYFGAAVIDGRPGVFFPDRFSLRMKYVAANDEIGAHWTKGVEFGEPYLYSHTMPQYFDAEGVAGRPACIASTNSAEDRVHFYILK